MQDLGHPPEPPWNRLAWEGSSGFPLVFNAWKDRPHPQGVEVVEGKPTTTRNNTLKSRDTTLHGFSIIPTLQETEALRC